MTTTVCLNCGAELVNAPTGRPRRWCSDKCRKAGAGAATPLAPRPRPKGGGPIEKAAQTLVDELMFPPGDPRAVIALVTLQVAAAIDARPADVTLARELRLGVAYLTETPADPPNQIDVIRARYLKNRVEDRLKYAAGQAVETDEDFER